MQQTEQETPTNPQKQTKPVVEEKKSRHIFKRERKQAKEKRYVRRIFPIWLRIIVVFLLAFLALIIGMIIGFSVLGDGNPTDVLKFEFWQHVLDIINGVE
ncbi:DNA-directed RNA polymerase subunit beta [Amphibacillus sediminis]|uniref:DNA-directed RNA polymerase subunit beta n=1 Tax=Amphibacillus sediminis TaxID=360185 RepID=UPI000837A010|nr:DNA-directed RNA polymerase subunit beta [Amphibacillus sediminis]